MLQGYHNEAERSISLGGRGFLTTSSGWNYPGQPPKLLEMGPPKTTGVTKRSELSQKGNLLLQKSVQAQRHSKHMEQEISHFISEAVGPAPLLRLVLDPHGLLAIG
jgi:hypothetical protein